MYYGNKFNPSQKDCPTRKRKAHVRPFYPPVPAESGESKRPDCGRDSFHSFSHNPQRAANHNAPASLQTPRPGVKIALASAGVTQLAEYLLPKQVVASSNLVTRLCLN